MDLDTIHLLRRPDPPGLLRAAARVFRVQPLRVLRGRRLLGVALLVFAPVLVSALALARGFRDALGLGSFVDSAALFDAPIVFPITVLLLSGAALGDEIDDGTILYLRLRPIPRSSVVIGRWLSCALASFVLFAPAVTLRWCAQVASRGSFLAREGTGVLVAEILGAALAATVYSAFFLLLTLLIRRAVLVGLFYVFGWEMLVSTVVPSQAAAYTVAFHVKSLLWAASDEGPELASMMVRFEEAGLLPAAGDTLAFAVTATATLLALACWVFAHREYVTRPGDA